MVRMTKGYDSRINFLTILVLIKFLSLLIIDFQNHLKPMIKVRRCSLPEINNLMIMDLSIQVKG